MPEVALRCKKCKQTFENARRLGYHMWSKHNIRGKSKSSQATWKKRQELGVPFKKGPIKSLKSNREKSPHLDEMLLAVNIRRDAINDAYTDVARLLQGMRGGGR